MAAWGGCRAVVGCGLSVIVLKRRGRKGIRTPTIMTDISPNITSSLVPVLHFLRIGELAQTRYRVQAIVGNLAEQVVVEVVARRFIELV